MDTNVALAAASGQQFDAELYQRLRDKEQRQKDKYVKPLPIPQARNNDWETNALAGIKSKRLGLNHDWSLRTWGNKATVDERLKLLKDAGVDIAPLRNEKKARSEKISQAILDLIETRKQSPKTVEPPAFDISLGLLGVEDVAKEPFDPLFDEPPRLPPNKRKRDDSPLEMSSNPLESAHESEEKSPYKKLCIASLHAANPKETMPAEDGYNNWNDLKDMILTQIFDPCRTALKLQPERSSTPASHIVVKIPSLDDTSAVGLLELNQLGYECIMDELRILSDTTDEHGTINILEPAAAANDVRQSIKVITSIRRQTVLEGNLIALMGLLTRPSTKGVNLAHQEKSCFDASGVRTKHIYPYELSDSTHKQLEDVRNELETGWEQGTLEVTVRWKAKDLYKKLDVQK